MLCWLRHMVTLPRLESAASRCGLDFGKLKQALMADTSVGGQKNTFHFSKLPVQEATEDDMELGSVSELCQAHFNPSVVNLTFNSFSLHYLLEYRNI